MDLNRNGKCFLDKFLNFLCAMLGSQSLGATAMKKHHYPAKKPQPKSIMSTAKHAIVHVMVFGVISLAGHFATSSLSESVSAVGRGIAPPIGSMYLM